MKNSCLLDKNIVLDLLNLRPRSAVLFKLLAKYDQLYISSSTFLTIFYISRKLGKPKNQVFLDLAKFKILETGEIHCVNGAFIAKTFDDVEDCTEIIIAKEKKLDFITADKKLFVDYKSTWSKIVLVEVYTFELM